MVNKTERYKVFNRHIFIFISLFVTLLILSITCFLTSETNIALLLLIGAVLISLGIFLSPLYFVFSPKTLTVVWLLPFKRSIHWSEISKIIECKLFSTAIDGLSLYEIMYAYSYKGEQTVRQLDLPRNKQTRILVEKYAKRKIV